MTIIEASETIKSLLNEYPELSPEVIGYASNKLMQWYEKINKHKQSYNERIIANLATGWYDFITDEDREEIKAICKSVYPIAPIKDGIL